MLTKVDGGAIITSDTNAVLVATPQAQALAQAINQTTGVYDLSKGQVISGIKIPTSINVSVRSNAGTDAANTNMKLFNNNLLGDNPTNNGSGADSIVTTFGDGRSGNIYGELFAIATNGNGLKIKGFNVSAKTISTGTAASEFFSQAQLKVLLNTLKQEQIPFEIDLDEAYRNTQFNNGLLTIKCDIDFNRLMQLSYNQDPDTLVNWTFFTNASSFKG